MEYKRPYVKESTMASYTLSIKKTVSVLLGHADIATTLNMYVHPDETQKRNVVNKVFRTLSR